MNNHGIKALDRILAVLLVFALAISMMPTTSFAAAEDYPGQFIFTVKNGQDPVPEAEITYEVKVNGAGQGENHTKTDSDGTVGIDLSEFANQIGGDEEVKLSYTVSKEGFKVKSDEITVSSLSGNADVELESEDSETVQITVSKTGDGTVTLNGQDTASLSVEKGEQVTVVVTPGNHARINSLTIKGVDEPVGNKHEAYTTTVDADSDIQIAAAFVTEVTVTAIANGSGTIKLNGQEQSSVTVDKGSQVTVAVTPSEGYQISSVTIGGEPKDVSDDVYNFSDSIIVENDTTVSAQFVREYTIKITKDGNGNFTTTPDNDGGSVTVVDGSTVKVTATPEENYRVSKVVINTGETTFEDNTYDHDHPWSKDLNVTEDYTIEITFAPTCFNITYAEDANGSVYIQDTKVDYDGSTTADITANDGYNIKSVQVNGTDTGFEQINNKTARITISNITEDKKIVVTYEAIETVDMPADVAAFKDDAIRTDEETGLYVYANDATVFFSTDKAGISINGISADGEQFKTQSVTVSETTEVKSIYLYYDHAWHNVKLDKPIKIVIDREIAEPTLTPEKANANGYYNKDVKVDISAEDTGDYSGIAKVEYWVTSGENATETKRETIYSNDGSKELSAKIETSIIVDATQNNSDYVTVYLKVTDLAGNENETSCQLKINSTHPTIKVAIDGTLHAEAETGYYNAKRTATVTYTDRASTFDQNAAFEGITITATDGDKAPVSISKVAMISWSDNGDEHIATIEFATDANYEWSISYTNKAGLSNEPIVDVTGDAAYKFTVDTKAPSSATIELDGSTWSDIVSVLTFGLWKNYSVTATVTATKDAISPVKDVLYYKDAGDSVLSEAELDQHYTDGDFVETPYTISADEKFVIYARVTDYAGNTMYISTNGVIYDKTVGSITFKPVNSGTNGIYTDDVQVEISVDDTIQAGSVSSGIKKIDYKVESVFAGSDDPVVTASGTLYDFSTDEDVPDPGNPTYDQLKTKWSGMLTIDAKENNSDKVTVTVMVEDNAGNKYEATLDPALTIVVDQPTAVIVLGNDAYKENRHDDSYFIEQSAKIIVTDRNASFNAERAFAGITITATNSAKENITLVAGVDYTISDEWTYSVAENRETHTATIQFVKDGNYTISFNYLNNSEIEENRVDIKGKPFTKDATDPEGSIKIAENTWDKLLNILTFGLYSNVKVDVEATAKDETSPVTIEYYKDNGDTILTADELATKEFKAFEPFSVDDDERFTVYLKITDYAGNFIYVSSDGYIVDMKGCTIVNPVQEDFNKIYNKDVEIPIEITDAEPYSGIKRIDYRVIKDGNEAAPTQQDNLFTFSEENPTHDKLRNEWSGSITVEAEKNNSNNVVVIIEVEDNAGNITTKSISLKIDTTAPVIALSYPDDELDNNGNTYFDHPRTATVTITKRTTQFSAEDATAGIEITAVDAKGNAVNDSYEISGWNTVEGETPDDAKHTATIQFKKDANYMLEIAYTDLAGNPNVEITDVKGVAPWDFTVDTTPPTGTVKAVSAEGRVTWWDKLLPSLTYGFWSNKKITVTSTQDDVTSDPIASVEYYKVTSQNANDNVEALSKEALDAVTAWAPFEKVEVKANEQFVLYLKITDLAGNYTYICTDGLIVDDQAPIEETIAPEITVNPEQPINGLYNSDVDVAIAVEDPLVGGTYSGLKTVSYRVLNMGRVTQEETLYTFSEQSPLQSDLRKNWEGSITVDRTLNNSNDVKIEVIAEDNSGNTSRKDVSIKIDITAPKIDVSYNNNAADSGSFFKADRTATVVVSERNFDPKDVKVTITNTDGVIPSLSEWKQTSKGTGNQDDTTWAATITYSADGDYTFDITYTDLATNLMSGVRYGNSVAPTKFTIDKTLPTISVEYSNNSVKNEKYFKEARTATITVNEHNFNAARAKINASGILNRGEVQPVISSWSSNGNTHTATVVFDKDADYTFSVSAVDAAGNENQPVVYANGTNAPEDFVVDTEIEQPLVKLIGLNAQGRRDKEIRGTEDTTIYAYANALVPSVSFEDRNFDSYEIFLHQFQRTDDETWGTDDLSKYVTLEEQPELTSGVGELTLFEADGAGKYQPEDDGIYTLSVTATDKAGNSEKTSVTFTVNRFGSVYVYSDALIKLIANGGAYATWSDGNFMIRAEEDPSIGELKITEYNANKLIDGSLSIDITRDGRSISDVDYDVPEITGDGRENWFAYEYVISHENFNEDGVYRITLSSKDEAENEPESTPDNSITENEAAVTDTLLFRVDSTAPEITSIVGLEDRIINKEEAAVRYTVYDAIGLASMTVYINGEIAQTVVGSELAADPNNCTKEFTISERNSAQTVRILVEDLAGNVIDTDQFGSKDEAGNIIVPMPVYTFNNSVTVSTNAFVRWYANQPLFWGSIGGVVVFAGAIWFLIAFLRKRKTGSEK